MKFERKKNEYIDSSDSVSLGKQIKKRIQTKRIDAEHNKDKMFDNTPNAVALPTPPSFA